MSKDNEKEAILTLLLIECVRRLTKNGKNPIHINNRQIERSLENKYEVDYGSSDSNKFVLKLIKGEEDDLNLPDFEDDDGIILTESTEEE